MSEPMVRPLRRGELYLMVTSLPLRVTLTLAGGLAGGCWARLAVARRVQQATVARERRNMSESLFLSANSVEGSMVRTACGVGLDVRHDAQLERRGLSTCCDHARLNECARSSAG